MTGVNISDFHEIVIFSIGYHLLLYDVVQWLVAFISLLK